jgi:rhamnosyltransferase
VPAVGADSRGRIEATVFIPTFNGAAYLDRLLTAVETQDFAEKFEILIIDSGSTDDTLGIVSRHPLVRLVEIPQKEFGHGRTRNHAAQLARGTYVAYLSHDAIPLDAHWLEHLLEPMRRTPGPGGPACVAVFGRQVARHNCFPSLAYEIDGVFAACGPPDRTTLVSCAPGTADTLSDHDLFYSDVNSATRRDVLLGAIPYRDLNYSEDLAFARDVLNAGLAKAYEPRAAVEHSNDVTFAEYGKRVFDETRGRRAAASAAGAPHQDISWPGMLARIARDVARTLARIARDRRYSFAATLHWMAVNPWYLAKKWVNIRRALSDRDSRRFSLEAERASRAGEEKTGGDLSRRTR